MLKSKRVAVFSSNANERLERCEPLGPYVRMHVRPSRVCRGVYEVTVPPFVDADQSAIRARTSFLSK